MILNLFGLSGGKDSTALWGWAFNESGYPVESIRGSFCDTENEYDVVYDQIRKLDEYGRRRGALPIIWLRSEGFLNLCIRKKRFPSARARFCTEELKIKPFIRWCESLISEGHELLCHSGVRGDESTERSMLGEFGQKTYTKHLTIKERRPLLKWSIEQVWGAHKKWGLPINPLYLQGRKRVGCRLCCMSNKEDVRLCSLHHPETIDLYELWERKVSDAKGGSASFFRASTVPETLRSIKGLVRKRDSANGKKGEIYSANTIRDVVKWAWTLRGGKQTAFKFMFEEDDAHLPCKSGWCE